METNLVYIFSGLVLLTICFLVGKRLLRLAMKFVLVGIVLTALLAAAGYGWWNGWFNSQTSHSRRPAATRTAPQR